MNDGFYLFRACPLGSSNDRPYNTAIQTEAQVHAVEDEDEELC